MFGQLKAYLYGIGAAIIAGLLGLLKYRGWKIKRQEQEIEQRKREHAAMEQYHAQKDKVQTFESENKLNAEKAKHVAIDPTIPDGDYTL